MKHFHPIASGIDTRQIMAQLDQHPELWNAQRDRQSYDNSPHRHVSDVWVRYNDIAKGDLKSLSDEHVPIWYPAWGVLTALEPVVRGLMNSECGDMIGGVLITKLPPGDTIYPHRDAGWHVDYYSKFYLTLQADAGAVFCCQGNDGEFEVLHNRTGEIWYMDNRKTHWVKNNGTVDRITMIICIRTAKNYELPAN